MTKFKRRIVTTILRRRTRSRIIPDDMWLDSIPVEEKYPMKFDDETGKITVNGTELKITDDPYVMTVHCTLCDFVTTAEHSRVKAVKFVDRLYNHVAGSHYDAFRCHLCPKRLPSRGKFREHLSDHANFESRTCNICGKPLFRRDSVARHKWRHLNEDEKAQATAEGKAPKQLLVVGDKKVSGVFTCSVCGKTFGNKLYLIKHEAIHDERDLLTCEKCGKVMLRRAYLSYHSKYVCPLENDKANYTAVRIKCLLCDNTYKTKVAMKKHMKRIHTENALQRTHICEICGKGYKSESDVKVHAKTHSTERPFKCSACGKDFNLKKNLARHKCKSKDSILHN